MCQRRQISGNGTGLKERLKRKVAKKKACESFNLSLSYLEQEVNSVS